MTAPNPGQPPMTRGQMIRCGEYLASLRAAGLTGPQIGQVLAADGAAAARLIEWHARGKRWPAERKRRAAS